MRAVHFGVKCGNARAIFEQSIVARVRRSISSELKLATLRRIAHDLRKFAYAMMLLGEGAATRGMLRLIHNLGLTSRHEEPS